MSIFLGNKTERQELQALSRVKDDKILYELVKSRIDELKSSLTTATDLHQIHRLQGKVLILEDFLDAADKSRKVLERK